MPCSMPARRARPTAVCCSGGAAISSPLSSLSCRGTCRARPALSESALFPATATAHPTVDTAGRGGAVSAMLRPRASAVRARQVLSKPAPSASIARFVPGASLARVCGTAGACAAWCPGSPRMYLTARLLASRGKPEVEATASATHVSNQTTPATAPYL
jgi:hypothetical protein